MKNMKLSVYGAGAAAALLLATGCGSLTHVPAGQSVLVAKAKRGEKINDPQPAMAGVDAPVEIPAVEPELPAKSVSDETSDYASLAALCVAQGRTAEAISAYAKIVEIDPESPEGWRNLAYLYETTGDQTNAMLAFKKYKSVAAR